jgi:two-component system sensor histidine kinase RpfC
MLTALIKRLEAAPDNEGVQAMVRVFFIAAILHWHGLIVGPGGGGWTPDKVLVAVAIFGFLVIAVGIIVSIYIHPKKSVLRRVIGMLADAGGVTLFVWLADQNAMLGISLYLFLMLSYGFRYGVRYLYSTQVLCVVGFLSALIAVPYWQRHRIEGIHLLITTLIAIPTYVGFFVRHRSRMEQELRAKLEGDNSAA